MSMTESEANELNKRITDLKESIKKKKMDVSWHKENPKVWNDGGKRIREGEKFIRENEQLLGYLEEFRELKEKATAKKPIPLDKYREYNKCPNCGGWAEDSSGSAYRYCPNCGTEFDWSEGKE